MTDCCIRWPLCGADVTGQCPTPTHSDDDIAGVLANDAAAADRLLAIHNRTRGPVATVPRDDLRRLIDAHSGALSSAQSMGALPATVRPPACDCGRPEIPGHACTACVDPVDRALALHLAADAAEEALTPEQRLRFRRLRVEHFNARTAPRLAAGPP